MNTLSTQSSRYDADRYGRTQNIRVVLSSYLLDLRENNQVRKTPSKCSNRAEATV